MKNILLLGLLAVFLSSCSESVQEIQVTTIEVSKTPLNLPNPDPLKLQDVEWIIITKDNANRCMEIASGSPLTEEEIAVTKKSKANLDCPRLANPNYVPK